MGNILKTYAIVATVGAAGAGVSVAAGVFVSGITRTSSGFGAAACCSTGAAGVATGGVTATGTRGATAFAGVATARAGAFFGNGTAFGVRLATRGAAREPGASVVAPGCGRRYCGNSGIGAAGP